MIHNAYEMKAIGYNLTFLTRALVHLANMNNNWAGIGAVFLKRLKNEHRFVWNAKDKASLSYLTYRFALP